MEAKQDRKPLERLIDARNEFTAFLCKEQSPLHYLSITSLEDGPLRRCEVNNGGRINAGRRGMIDRNFRYNRLLGQWTGNDGVAIVTEDTIYDAILSKQRDAGNAKSNVLWNRIKKVTEGIEFPDVAKASSVWRKHSLKKLSGSDFVTFNESAKAHARSIQEHLVTTSTPTSTERIPSSPETRYGRPRDAQEEPTSQFHRRLHNTLRVGTSYDGTDVWLQLAELPGKKVELIFYNSAMTVTQEKDLKINWHHELDYSTFPGDNAYDQQRAQRKRIWQIIQSHDSPSETANKAPKFTLPREQSPGSKSYVPPSPTIIGNRSRRIHGKKRPATPAAESSGDDVPLVGRKRVKHSPPPADPVVTTTQVLNDLEICSTRPAKPATPPATPQAKADAPSQLSTGVMPRDLLSPFHPSPLVQLLPDNKNANLTTPILANVIQPISPSVLDNTVLLVVSSNQPHRAAANVLLNECTTLDQLFQTLIIECNLKGKAASNLAEVSVTYTWDGKQHLIRKSRARDWTVFMDTVRKAWEKEGSKFADEGCEIKMMAHVDI